MAQKDEHKFLILFNPGQLILVPDILIHSLSLTSSVE